MKADKLAESRIFRKKLLPLVLPITFQQFMVAVVSASDAIMFGAIRQNREELLAGSQRSYLSRGYGRR